MVHLFLTQRMLGSQSTHSWLVIMLGSHLSLIGFCSPDVRVACTYLVLGQGLLHCWFVLTCAELMFTLKDCLLFTASCSHLVWCLPNAYPVFTSRLTGLILIMSQSHIVLLMLSLLVLTYCSPCAHLINLAWPHMLIMR